MAKRSRNEISQNNHSTLIIQGQPKGCPFLMNVSECIFERMSQILYLHQYFKTPSEAGASRSYFLAKAMVEAGHQVTIITQGDFNKEEVFDGIKVIYLENQYSNKMGVLKRIRAYFQFYFSAKNTAKQLDFDFIYATSTPLLVGWLGRKLAIKRKIQYFFEVRDLWPDFPIQAGVLPFPFSWMLRKMERVIYRDAQKIVTCSKGIYETVCQRTIPGKVLVASNFSPFPKVEIEKDTENFIYFGSLGRYNGIELWRPFLERWKEVGSGAQWYVVGEGAQESLVEQLALEFPFLHLMKPIPRNELLSFIREKNIRYSWVTFSSLPVLQTNSPNKLFDSWQWGLIPIINQHGWMNDWAGENAAVFYHHTNPDQTIQQLLKINISESELQKFQNGTKKASAYFDSNKSISEVIDAIPLKSNHHRKKWAIISPVHPPYDQRLSQRIPEWISSQYLVYYLGKGRGLPSFSSPWIRMLLFYPWIILWILCHRIQVILLADPEMLPLGILLNKCGFDVVWDVHEDFDEQFQLKGKKSPKLTQEILRLEQILLKLKAKLWVTEKYYSLMPRYRNFSPQFLPNFPSSYPFKLISQKFEIESDQPKFIYVGVINEFRGMHELFGAWERVMEVYPKAELILVGRSTMVIPNSIRHFEGNWLEIVPFISGAWAGISLIKKVNEQTHYPFLSFPTKIGEYTRLGLPVVCNRTPIHEEFLKDTGVFVDEISVNQLSERIISFIRQENERLILKKNALKKRSDFQNNSESFSKISELYQI